MPALLHLLLIEDNPLDARLLRGRLAGLSSEFDVADATTLTEGIDALTTGQYEVVVLDLSLPDSTGLATYARVRDAAAGIPVIVLTGTGDGHLGEEAVRMGAQDYLTKGSASAAELVRAIRYGIRRQRNLTDVEQAARAEIDAKSFFLSHVSHELRTPLAVIAQFVSLLADGVVGEVTPDQQECLTVTMRNVNQLRMMINDLLAVTRIEGGRMHISMQATPGDRLVLDCVRDFEPTARDRGVSLHASLPDGDLEPVQADPDRMREVLGNLIDNAIKFTPAGGSVLVAADQVGAEMHFTVTDTGRGVAADELEAIFGRFHQESPEIDQGRSGLGLGLFVCRELMTAQHGRIWAESTVATGTRITVALPLPAADHQLVAAGGPTKGHVL